MAQIDPQLLKRCRKKDRRAQNQLYELCFGFLMPVCMRYANSEDDAMSYLNLGFYKMLNNLKRYRLETPFEAWSKRVLINCIIDEMRRQKRYRQQIEIREDILIEPKEDEAYWEHQLITCDDVYRFIQNLPPSSSSVFNLYVMDGYKQAEIAEMLGISLGTVKWHYAEARKRLKKMILEHCERKSSKEKLAS